MTALTELLARVETAQGADRELDLAIAIATRTGSFNRSTTFEHIADVMREQEKDGGLYVDADTGLTCVRSCFVEVPLITSNIDDAIALVKRLLPGRRWQVQSTDWEYGGPSAVLSDDVWQDSQGRRGRNLFARGATPALAVIAALLRALIAQERTDV